MGGRDGLHLSSSSLASSSACRGLSEVGNLFILYLLLNMYFIFSLLSMYCKYWSRNKITNLKKVWVQRNIRSIGRNIFSGGETSSEGLKSRKGGKITGNWKGLCSWRLWAGWPWSSWCSFVQSTEKGLGLGWHCSFSPLRQDYSGSCQYLRLIPEGFVFFYLYSSFFGQMSLCFPR